MNHGLIALEALRGHDSAQPLLAEDREDLSRKRSAVQQSLTADIDQMLGPLGYSRSRDTWRKAGTVAISALQFQKGQYGFGAFFNAGAGIRWTLQDLRFHRLSEFCPELGNQAPDELSYLRLHDDPAFRKAILTVIRARMVPWMEARHGLSGAFTKRHPADMRRVSLFTDS